MKLRKLLILAVFLAVLVVLGLVKKAYDQRTEALQNKNQKTWFVLNQGLSADFVDRIEIYSSVDDSSKIRIRKADSGEWLLDLPFAARARKGSIDSFLKDLTSVRGETRAESKNVLQDFKLDEKQGIHLVLKGSGKELSHTLLSPLRPGGTVNFVRTQNLARVIATDTDLLGDLGIYSKQAVLDPKVFIDLKVIQLELNKVKAFQISSAKPAPLKFTKQKNEKDNSESWSIEPPEGSAEIDKTKIDSFLSNLSNLYATQAIDPKGGDFGINETSPWIRISLLDGPDKHSELSLFINGETDKDKCRYLKVMPIGTVYRILEIQINNLNKDKTFFLKDKTDPKKS